MGTTNAQGVYIYDATDQISPIHTLLNLQSSALTTALSPLQKGYVHIASSAADRNAQATAYAPSVSKPFVCYRSDATAGQNIEYTTNGSTWWVIGNFVDRTGTASVLSFTTTSWAVTSGGSGVSFRQRGNAVSWRADVTYSGSPITYPVSGDIANTPVALIADASWAPVFPSTISTLTTGRLSTGYINSNGIMLTALAPVLTATTISSGFRLDLAGTYII